MSISCFSLCT